MSDSEREIKCYDDGCVLDPRTALIELDTDKVVVGGGFVPLEEEEKLIPVKSIKKGKSKGSPKNIKVVGAGKKKHTKKPAASKKTPPKTKSAPKKKPAKKPKTKTTVVGKGKAKGTPKKK